jgi:hypothetical protein
MFASKNSTVGMAIQYNLECRMLVKAFKSGVRSRFLVTLCMTFKMGVIITLYRFYAVFT